MKKILLLLLLTVYSYGQTLQNPTFGNTTTNTLKVKTPATVTSINYLSTIEVDGSIAKIAPVSLPFLTKVSTITPNAQAYVKRADGTQTMLDYVSSTVINDSGVIGGSVADALNTLNTGKINLTEKGAVNGVATLGTDGKVPNNQIPALAISETFPVSSQAQMLALSGAEQGDVAIRSDISKSFILRVSPASILANWSELLSPTDAVTSVNGQVGVVSLTTANVPDIAGKRYQTDNQKLFNDATSSIQTQLNSKAIDNDVLHKTGDETKTGDLMANNFILPAQPLGTSIYSFSGVMASTDTFKIYGTDGGADAGILVFQVGDNGVPFSSGGQKFSFRYYATFSGEAKTPFEIDYNDITANAIINANFNINSNANIISNGMIFTDSVRPNTGNNLTLLNGGANMLLVDGSARITALSGAGTRTVVTDASGNLSATDIAPTSGTYTPTFTNLANITSIINVNATYTKIGNIVTVEVFFTCNVTTQNAITTVAISLPVNRSATTALFSGLGLFHSNSNIVSYPASLAFTIGNQTSSFTGIPPLNTSGAGIPFTCSFQYDITK